jgi:uncharacterized protein (TIGR02300 family)
MADRGLKRICASCGTKFYDFGKLPIICPSCKAEFTGEIEVKSRRGRSSIVPDTVKRGDIEAKNLAVADLDDDTISLEDLDEGDMDDDLDIDEMAVDAEEEDFDNLDEDIDIDLDKED